MKKLFWIVPVLALFVVAGCGKTTPTTTPTTTATLQTFVGSGFSLQYPSTWNIQENVYGAQLMLFSPQLSGDKFRENIGIITEVLPTDITVADYYTTIKAQLQSLIKDYTELSNEDITINGVAAKKIVYEGTQDVYKLKWLQVFLVKNKTAYVINYTTIADSFNDFLKDAEGVINSFTLQ